MKNWLLEYLKTLLRYVGYLVLAVGVFSGTAGLFSDWRYYHSLHAEMNACAAFIEDHQANQNQFPTKEEVEEWRNLHGIKHHMILGNVSGEEERPVLAHWNGDNFEIRSLKSGAFTTSIKAHLLKTTGFSITFTLAGVVLIWMSNRLRGRRASPKNGPQISPRPV